MAPERAVNRLLRSRRVLVAAALLLAALIVGGVTVSTAVFTGRSTSSASAGAHRIDFAVSPAGSIVDTTALRPGATHSGQVTLANHAAPASFTLRFTGLGTGPLPGVLQLTVQEISPIAKQLYNGVLAAVPAITLGKIAQGASVQIGFTYAWPAANQDAALQGQIVPLVLHWDAST